jgi:SAM-dependent methyltransferase
MELQLVSSINTISRPCPECGGFNKTEIAQGKDYEYRTCDNTFTVVRCTNCDLKFIDPMPTAEALPSVYPASYKPFHFNKGKKSLIMRVRDRLDACKARKFIGKIPTKSTVLDVGCGDGRYLGILKQVAPDWELHGIDFGDEAIRRCKQLGIAVTKGMYEEVDFGQNRFDLINLNQVIEHLPDPASVVKKIYGELKPGGILNVETPSLDGWDAKLFYSGFWGGYHFPRHLTFFTEATLGHFLESRGFVIESVEYMPSPVFWVFSWHHYWEACIGFGAGFFSDSNPLTLGVATAIDAFQMFFAGKTSNIRLIARKRA